MDHSIPEAIIAEPRAKLTSEPSAWLTGEQSLPADDSYQPRQQLGGQLSTDKQYLKGQGCGF